MAPKVKDPKPEKARKARKAAKAQKRRSLPTEWVDQIPVKASPFKARIVSIASIMLLFLGMVAWHLCPEALDAFLSRNGEIHMLYGDSLLLPVLQLIFMYFALVGAICAVFGIASLFRSRLTYRALRSALIIVYPLIAAYVWIAWIILFGVLDAGIDVEGTPQDRATILISWWGVAWPALAVAAYVGWLHVMLASRSVVAAFTKDDGDPLEGDAILEDLRTHGRDARSRRSMYASVMTHLLILVIIPMLLEMGGCVEAYKVPKGTGEPVVAMVKMVKPKKKKKKTLSLRPNSAIIFEVPDLDHTEVDEAIEEQSQVTYQASANAKAGKMGKGGPGKGGWPEGMDDYKIRFIRLDHGGTGWDDGMDARSGADINFLRAFANATGFRKIAQKGESHSIRLLKKYPKDGFPPFVYLTGNGNMGRVSPDEARILREYCMNGGMLVADAGSPQFHHSFRNFITRQVFPDKPLLDIADDDMLYQLPYGFPNGAPAFWHHGGRRALGIKHEGRWCVFYHPGDMNDAWKSQGYTDVSPEMRQAAINLGVNIIYYAFNQWDDAVSKARK